MVIGLRYMNQFWFQKVESDHYILVSRFEWNISESTNYLRSLFICERFQIDNNSWCDVVRPRGALSLFVYQFISFLFTVSMKPILSHDLSLSAISYSPLLHITAKRLTLAISAEIDRSVDRRSASGKSRVARFLHPRRKPSSPWRFLFISFFLDRVLLTYFLDEKE
ncbi:hypothetical protein KSP39_PZI019518 [Platanthera zijinensis]|uniref:Uncharacterized protein n=1 Tax=Platanthera zijinensis TaxID=2320716 RepID=A0AAP0B1K2_9ASPA